VLGEAVLGPERLRNRVGDERRIAEGSKADPEDACLELRHQLGRSFDRQPRLARAAGPGQGQEAGAVLEQRGDLRDLPVPADEGARRAGQVRVRDRLQGREALRAELEDRDRLREVLQPLLAEVGALPVDEPAGRRREQHLAAVPGGGDARAQVHVLAHVALLAKQRRAGVDPDAHANRTFGERGVDLLRRRERAMRRRERNEEGIALCIDLDTAVGVEGFAQDQAMRLERLCVPRRP
jgi:hypothetical protein